MKGQRKSLIAVLTVLALLIAFTAGSCASNAGTIDRTVFSDSNKPVYVTNTGSATISVIDLANKKVNRTIDLRKETSGNNDKQSHFLGVTPDGKILVVGEARATKDGRILFIDTQTDQVVKKFDVGAAIGLHLSRDGKWLFSVSNEKGDVNGVNYNNVINIFDVEKQEYLGKIDLGADPHVLDTSWDGKYLYTTTAVGGKLVAYDITGLPAKLPSTPFWTLDVLKDLKDSGAFTANQDLSKVHLHALTVHPNGKYVIVGSFDWYIAEHLAVGGGDVIVDVSTGKIVTRVPGAPHNYDLSPDRRYLLSGEGHAPDCEEDHYLHELGYSYKGPLVRIVDISELLSDTPDFKKIKVTGIIDGGQLADALYVNHQIYDSSGRYILVTTSGKNGKNGRTLIVDASDNYKLVANLEVGQHPHGLAFPGYGR